MTDFSKWTDEQINEAIFKAKGWVFAGKLSLCGWYRDTSKGRENLFDSTPPDYTHDWRLAGELLHRVERG